MKRFKVGLATSALVLVASTITVVGPSVAGISIASASPPQAPLNLANEQGTLWSCAFSPFNPGSLPYSFGVTYESLDFVNSLQSGKVTPWLASAYAWSNGNKTLTFTIRPGVKWSDGTPFSAADVAYTFALLKKYPALDINAVWSSLARVAQSGNKVVMNFKAPAVPFFYYVAGQVPIVPQHIWSKIANPVTATISNPVGTGGYLMSSCSGQNIQWKSNPHYWQKGKAQIKVVNMPAFLSNNTCNEYLASGQSAWGAQFIPNIQSSYLAKKAGNAIWFAPVANVSLFPNLTVPGLNDAKVRQAISDVLNRALISKIGEYGYEPPASQTGIIAPTFKSWVSPSAAAGLSTTANAAKGASVLKADGYKLVNGVYTKGTTKLSFTLTTNGGYSDWIAAMQVASQELTKFGIKITLQTPAQATFYANLYAGKYQLAYNTEAGGPTPFYELRQMLFSKNSAPIGTAAASNWERYSNASTDALLSQYATTTSLAAQKSIVAKLEGVMVSQAPVIPVLEEVDWFQYNATHISGFPSAANPYAQAGLYNEPDWGYVLDRLAPKA